jgi:Flp pilus assembly protein TadG
MFGLRISKRFGKSEDGVAAIEFGMLAIPFLMLIFAILETAIGFFAAQVFESGVDNIGREIRTGQIQSSSTTAAKVRTKICSKT